MIRSVYGDIKKEDLGVTMCHEHFIVDLSIVRKDDESKIETIEEVVPEIKKMMDLGAQSAIEVTTNDMYRDVKKLKEISEITKLNIVAATGFYLSEYHPDWLTNATAEEIADVMVKDLTEGIDGTDIKAGVIGEIASSKDSFVGQEKKVLIASAIAHTKTGAAVTTHTGKFTAIETIETLINNGVTPDKIVIGHQDLIDDTDYHLNILKYGVNIGFDTCGKVSYQLDETRAKNIIKIIEAGYGDHVMLSNDISRRTYFTTYGKFGYTAVLGRVVPMLKEYGCSQENIKKLLVDNPARIFNNDRW
ncbi:MAG: phosphotriesterase-related protein [Firmicutes bacterium]|nr:phosphotriesterase-related protein [Candidatus Colivicinus equi]